METVILHLNNGTKWSYRLISNTNNYIYMQDESDGTSMRYNKTTKELYSYDSYNSVWNFMKNTTQMIEEIEIE